VVQTHWAFFPLVSVNEQVHVALFGLEHGELNVPPSRFFIMKLHASA
jgi:hypothetical protein